MINTRIAGVHGTAHGSSALPTTSCLLPSGSRRDHAGPRGATLASPRSGWASLSLAGLDPRRDDTLGREPRIKSGRDIYAAAAGPPSAHGAKRRSSMPERLEHNRGRGPAVGVGHLNHGPRRRYPSARRCPTLADLRSSPSCAHENSPSHLKGTQPVCVTTGTEEHLTARAAPAALTVYLPGVLKGPSGWALMAASPVPHHTPITTTTTVSHEHLHTSSRLLQHHSLP
ncbi:hypothetical protein E2C01_025266 [Portunus trituberculatus]|uniref:Uncharacterized protein n=1 Tax=Portunus trituberculatus TaxID=210409 RepID=A0A5B7EF04_PORTR|nr:hypothetical protein [Portunus trituberculatus]